ncbi:hypothetical protein QE400_000076 [Xanthomonas sacchari]|uniref:hypothetical protein n=1 Tax=Xanthomonas sacchari TaxID=56458 RepID=UPI0027819F46|nr:hypothetical protein [Xanthomonas sacchari]MDQ1090663.1 hypothetical protein [Xanthomonas sacchari]
MTTTLKYLSLPDLTASPDHLIPDFGHVDVASTTLSEMYLPLRHGLNAWIRGNVPQGPDWEELHLLSEAVRGLSDEVLCHESLRQQLLNPHIGSPLIFNYDATSRRPYPMSGKAGLRESFAKWLHTSYEDDVFLTVYLADSPSFSSEVLIEALRSLSSFSSRGRAPPPQAKVQGLPEETAASAAARQEAIEGWPTAHEVGLRLPGRSGAPAQRASRLRRLNKLFGVWIPEERGYRFAPWQFLRSGEPAPLLPEILNLVRGSFGVAAGARTSGWEELEWFLAPHALVGGRTPAQLLGTDPEECLALARADFAPGAADARW